LFSVGFSAERFRAFIKGFITAQTAFFTAHFQFITAHFVRHCALKDAPRLIFLSTLRFRKFLYITSLHVKLWWTRYWYGNTVRLSVCRTRYRVKTAKHVDEQILLAFYYFANLFYSSL